MTTEAGRKCKACGKIIEGRHPNARYCRNPCCKPSGHPAAADLSLAELGERNERARLNRLARIAKDPEAVREAFAKVFTTP